MQPIKRPIVGLILRKTMQMKLLCFSTALVLSLANTAFGGNFAAKVSDATFKLFHPKSTSTCFLLQSKEAEAPYFLVTTAHTLERTDGDTATLVLRTPKNGGYERLDHAIPIRRENKPLWVRHETQDVAVLKLSGEMPVTVAALPVEWLANDDRLKAAEVDVCSPLFVLTYPERFEANAAGFPVARMGIFSSPPLLSSRDHPTFLADFTTFSGDSGGPVFIATDDVKTPLVVGIVLGRQIHDEKINSKYEDRHLRRPLGLGIVLHARHIRDTLDLL